MNHLSLYLLLAADHAAEPEVPGTDVTAEESPARQVRGRAGQQAKPVYEPRRQAGKALLQASYRRVPAAQCQSAAFGSVGFSVSVLANAAGFLLMTSGLLLLLHIAHASLG